jgi:hypothetical protein
VDVGGVAEEAGEGFAGFEAFAGGEVVGGGAELAFEVAGDADFAGAVDDEAGDLLAGAFAGHAGLVGVYRKTFVGDDAADEAEEGRDAGGGGPGCWGG